MKFKGVCSLFLLSCCTSVMSANYMGINESSSTINAPHHAALQEFGLKDVRALIQQNRSVIIQQINRQVANENLQKQKAVRLPDLHVNGDGYLSHKLPLTSPRESDESFLYHFNVESEFDLYTGGRHTQAINRLKNEHQLSEEKLKAVTEEIELQAYILLYDIHRNIKYREFVQSSIHLREKEYERIDQLFKNGLVLKSDLLRSKLYITNLQKDEIAIKNSIDILSDKLCVLLGLKDRYAIRPSLTTDLNYKIVESFDALFQYALMHSPELQMHHTNHEHEKIVLKEIHASRMPQLKLYGKYGVGSPFSTMNFKHQLGGEIGAKVSIPLSAFYKSKHAVRAQKEIIKRQELVLTDEEEKLKNSLYELYTRYHESLINIDRALEKINLSKESYRILNNSYFNQQALLIDVLESETQSMEASFEWVEAVVDSQKYYWALKKLCGYLQ